MFQTRKLRVMFVIALCDIHSSGLPVCCHPIERGSSLILAIDVIISFVVHWTYQQMPQHSDEEKGRIITSTPMISSFVVSFYIKSPVWFIRSPEYAWQHPGQGFSRTR